MTRNTLIAYYSRRGNNYATGRIVGEIAAWFDREMLEIDHGSTIQG